MQEAGNYSHKHELNQAKLQNTIIDHTNSSLVHKEKSTLYIASKIGNTQKEMKLYSVLHRISSI